ncbi:MAG: hypothetical protein HZC42_04440 [Candidatus Eisenbacteria bacterium]|nr:hypothetical protein [Candidatus Eisenbacteria bacterium]
MRQMARRWVTALAVVATLGALVPARAAGAQGINLAWDSCGPSGVTNRDFACNANTGAENLVVSYTPPQLLLGPVDIISARIYIYAVDDTVVPSWWLLQSGGCRSGAVSMTTDAGSDAAYCQQPPAPVDSSKVVYIAPDYYPNRSLLGAYEVFHSPGASLLPGTEYFGFRFAIDHAKTIGSDSCAGCSRRASLLLDEVNLVVDQVQSVDVRTPLRQNVITWQYGLVPVRAKTWGQIKGLYLR